jgi:hypothetical protein
VLGFFSSRSNGDSPIPSPAGECVYTRLVVGGTHTLGNRGGGPNSDEGTDTVVLLLYTYSELDTFAVNICVGLLAPLPVL